MKWKQYAAEIVKQAEQRANKKKERKEIRHRFGCNKSLHLLVLCVYLLSHVSQPFVFIIVSALTSTDLVSTDFVFFRLFFFSECFSFSICNEFFSSFIIHQLQKCITLFLQQVGFSWYTGIAACATHTNWNGFWGRKKHTLFIVRRLKREHEFMTTSKWFLFENRQRIPIQCAFDHMICCERRWKTTDPFWLIFFSSFWTKLHVLSRNLDQHTAQFY